MKRPMKKSAAKGTAKPSVRLAAQRTCKDPNAAAPETSAVLEADGVSFVSGSMMLRVGPEKVRFKWLVKSKTEVAALAGDQLVPHWAVQLEAVYEPVSILDGQATVQGNQDNRAFGAGVPKAEISMILASKAVADTYEVGRAYHSDWTLAAPVVRALY